MAKRRHYKQPNGYGSVYMERGNRARPYRAMVTIDRVLAGNTAKQIRKTIGYYETREAALAALLAYRADKYDIDKTKMTFAEVYERWSEEHFPTITDNSQRSLRAAYRAVQGLHTVRMTDIRTEHLETAVRASGAGVATKKKMTQLLSMMFKYAMAHDIVSKNYAALCNYRLEPEEPVIDRVIFTPEEIRELWEKDRDIFDDMILFSIYTGVRPGELVTIKTENIDLEARTIVGGIKTDAGKDRVIPIHKDILPVVEKYHAMGYVTLFSSTKIKGRAMPYQTYRDKFTERYLGHTCYDTRHTFVTAWKKQSLNEYILKRIVGHRIGDVSEKFYTHRDIENLRDEMDKLILKS